jgi:hypothetical protein
MRNPPETLQNPRDILIGLARTNEFLEARRRGAPLPSAMAAAAMRCVEVKRQAHHGRLDIEGNALDLISTIPDFIDGRYELDRINERERRSRVKVPRSVKIPHLEKVIAFDHALRETIDNNPRQDPKALHGFIARAASGVYRSDELDFNYLNQATSECITGMHHEIDTEQALWLIDGVEDIENADTAAELEGIDLSFTYHRKPFSIDVKASAVREQEAWKQWEPGDALPFWTGINSSELGNRFRPTDQQAQAIAARLEGLLQQNLRFDGNYAIV